MRLLEITPTHNPCDSMVVLLRPTGERIGVLTIAETQEADQIGAMLTEWLEEWANDDPVCERCDGDGEGVCPSCGGNGTRDLESRFANACHECQGRGVIACRECAQ